MTDTGWSWAGTQTKGCHRHRVAAAECGRIKHLHSSSLAISGWIIEAAPMCVAAGMACRAAASHRECSLNLQGEGNAGPGIRPGRPRTGRLVIRCYRRFDFASRVCR
jgi:hypothetical protein